jgi:hypothetical protein
MRVPCITAIFLLSALIPLNCLYAKESDATLSIQGDIQRPVQWSIEQLKEQLADQIQEVEFRNTTATGIPLLSVIKAVEPKVRIETKWTLKDEMHRNMAFLVTLEAKDSYKVFFTLTELMPEFGDAPAWLVWEFDGEPLTDVMALLCLVSSNDDWPDRGIYGIVKITVADLNTITDQLKFK